jgi:hypothetical protein
MRRRYPGRPVLRAFLVVLAILAGPAASSRLGAENGDLLSISGALAGKEVVDITLDSTDGTFWVLGANGSSTASHRIYRLSADLQNLLGFVENPHPTGTIAGNNLTTNRGIAYRPASQSLFVLSSVGPRGSQQFQIKEITKEGVEKPAGAFSIVAPLVGASLYGLAYDTVAQQLWMLDIQNDQLIRSTLAGEVTRSLRLPGKRSPETLIKGQGLAFDVEGVNPRLYVAYGDLFHLGPSKIIQLSTEGKLSGEEQVGMRTGIEVPLDAVPSPDRRGFHVYRQGALRRIALLGGVDKVYQLEQVLPNPIPPSELVCRLTLTNQVHLSWRNHGGGSGSAYRGLIQILRNGVPLTAISGDSISFTDTSPVLGTSSYALRASESAQGSFSPAGCKCEVTVGAGGLVDWREAPGSTLFDVAVDPATKEVYVTDDIQGKIFRLDSNLDLIAEIPSPWPNPGGIAFVPSIQVGFPPPGVLLTNVLAVAETSGNRLRLFEVADPDRGTTVSLQMEVATPQISGLCYVPSSGRFVAVEQQSLRIYEMTATGSVVRSCLPPEIILSQKLDRGLTYDPIQQTFLAVFKGEEKFQLAPAVHELFFQGNCLPSSFQIGMSSLGEGYREAGFAGGIAIDGNTLLVCGRKSRALVRILIFPFSPTFVRGDFDSNLTVNLTDAVALAKYLFQAGPAPKCQDAADANDDGILDVSDPVYLLFALFIPGSPPPPPPYPEPGEDPTFRDSLGCAK